MNVTACRQDYLARLKAAIEASHSCKATYRRSVTVQEKLPRKWKGQVEIFWLTGHPSAKRCFAWLEPCNQTDAELRVITVLEIPPVIGPATAVKSVLSSNDTQP